MGLRERVTFAVDPGSAAIDALGIRRARTRNPSKKASPTRPPTCSIEMASSRFVDTREDFHIWLDPAVVVNALANLR